MKNTKYVSLLVIIALALGFTIATPVFAKTNSGLGRGQMQRPAVVGTVSAVNGTTFTVTSKSRTPRQSGSTNTTTTYTINAANATVTKGGASSSVSNITVGDTVTVQGTVTGTNVAATTIRDGKMGEGDSNQALLQIQGNGQPVIAGAVSAINGSVLTITNNSNITYTADATNAKVIQGKNTILLSDIKVGDSVIVQGAVNGTSVTASTVIDQKASTNNNSGSSSINNQKPQASFMGGIVNFFKRLFGF